VPGDCLGRGNGGEQQKISIGHMETNSDEGERGEKNSKQERSVNLKKGDRLAFRGEEMNSQD